MPKGALFSWWYMLEEKERERCQSIVRSLALASGLSASETVAAARRCSFDEARVFDGEKIALRIAASFKKET